MPPFRISCLWWAGVSLSPFPTWECWHLLCRDILGVLEEDALLVYRSEWVFCPWHYYMLDQTILSCGSWPMYCTMFGSILGLYPLGASSSPLFPSCDNWKCLQTLPNVSWGTKSALVKNHQVTRWCRFTFRTDGEACAVSWGSCTLNLMKWLGEILGYPPWGKSEWVYCLGGRVKRILDDQINWLWHRVLGHHQTCFLSFLRAQQIIFSSLPCN